MEDELGMTLQESIESMKQEKRKEVEMKKKWFTGNDVLNAETKEGIWLWKDYVPKEALTGITGPSDTGKSTLLRQLALAVAGGERSFLGNDLLVESGNVIYAATEDSAIGMKESFTQQVHAVGLDEGQLNNVHFIFETENMIEEVEVLLNDKPFDLVILDCVGDLLYGNPNDYIQVRQQLGRIRDMAVAYHCAFILLHHNVKNSEKGAPDKNKMNGSQGMESKMRSLIELRLNEKNNDERLLTILKGNYVPVHLKKQSRCLNFSPDNFVYSDTGKSHDFAAGGERAVHYDKATWLRRYYEHKDGSILKTIDKLKGAYPLEEVPGKTWFIGNLKDTTILLEGDLEDNMAA